MNVVVKPRMACVWEAETIYCDKAEITEQGDRFFIFIWVYYHSVDWWKYVLFY